AGLIDLGLQHFGSAANNQLQRVDRVVIESLLDSESCAERRREHAEPRRRANEREALDRHRDGLRLWAFRQPDIDPVILHRWIQELLDHRTQAMNLVDEKD